MPTYEDEHTYIAFESTKDNFEFYSFDKSALDVLTQIIPDSERNNECVRISYDTEFAIFAIKVAINYAFNPNKVVYTNIKPAVFVDRPNRFIANIIVDGKKEICHVKNTGRCKELLTPNAKILVKKHSNPNRKTDYSLISVYKGDRLINMDSQVPNKAVYNFLLQGKLIDGLTKIKPEYTYGDSRIDFYMEKNDRKYLLEVKGVTLEENGIALFPDAPTERGIAHINELIKAKKEGYTTYLIFVIQMTGVKHFTPNTKTHKEFADALQRAQREGVNILAYDTIVTENSIAINSRCHIDLD